MQFAKELNLRLKPKAPASAVPRSWYMFVNNVLRYLKIENGRLLVNNDKWTLVCGGNVWSGYWWYGGEENGPANNITGKYFGCDLRTGAVQFADETDDTDNIEWRYVANKNEDTGEYTLSNRTCGDIVFRIT
jgi:hypothetical protein